MPAVAILAGAGAFRPGRHGAPNHVISRLFPQQGAAVGVVRSIGLAQPEMNLAPERAHRIVRWQEIRGNGSQQTGVDARTRPQVAAQCHRLARLPCNVPGVEKSVEDNRAAEESEGCPEWPHVMVAEPSMDSRPDHLGADPHAGVQSGSHVEK